VIKDGLVTPKLISSSTVYMLL